MKILLITLLTLASLSSLACSPSFLEKEYIEKRIVEKFGNDISELRYLKFRDTRYWGGETRNEMCPRFRINGKAKLRFIVNNSKECTLTAKENYSGKYDFDVKLKKIRCRKI